MNETTAKAKCVLTLVTPEHARMWLATIGLTIASFRGDAVCHVYASQMKDDSWPRNGSCLVLDWNGALVDGKQRLAAIILSGKSIPMDIVSGVDPDVRKTIDFHKRRTVGDLLHVAGYVDSVRLAAVCNGIQCMLWGIRVNHKAGRHLHLGFAKANPDIQDAIAAASKVANVSPAFLYGTLAPAIFLTRRIDRAKSDEFFGAFAMYDDADEAQRREPWAALVRHYRGLMKNAHDPVRRRTYAHAYTVMAWNAFMAGKKAAKFEFDPTGDLPRFADFDPYSIDQGNDDDVLAGSVVLDHASAKSDGKIRVEIVLMTPARAKEILERNGPLVAGGKGLRNRKLSKQTVDQYARDMRAGGWPMNGQSIKISILGHLLDGQHRLEACVQSGRSFYTVVVQGLPETVFSTYDTHTKKNFGHYLATKGVRNATTAASALRILWRGLERGFPTKCVPSPIELAQVEAEHLDAMTTSITLCSAKAFRMLMPAPILAVLHYVMSNEAPAPAKEFFHGLATGIDLGKHDPVLALRNTLIEWKGKSGSAVSEHDRLAWSLKAWVARQHGRPMTQLQLKRKIGFVAPYHEPIQIGRKDGAPSAPAIIRLSDTALRAA